jgi:hypothetical protein
MARIFEDWERTSKPTVAESDAAEKRRTAQATAYAQQVAARPTGLAALEQIQAELATSLSQSRERAAAAEADVGAGEVAKAEAIEAQVQARSAAETIAKETGSYINPRTGIITPSPNLKKPVIDDGTGGNNDKGGNIQFVEYEYSADFTKRRAKYFNPATGQFTYGEWEDAPLSKADFDAMQAKKLAEEAALNEKRDSFALIEATMRSYGFTETELKEIVDYIQAGLLNPKLGPNQLLLQLRQLPSYKARFAGNEERRARGLNAISEAAYLQQERDYSETLRLYGQQRLGSRNQYATLIGNDISNTELGRRVNIAVNRLQNSDPAILTQLKTYFPTITDSDIVAYFLNPKETLPELEVKTTTAEIGATAKQFGLAADFARASELQKYGVDLTRARAGYENVARLLPRGMQLSDIYRQAGIEYNQTVAEQEEFKGLASARRAREQLAGLELAAFSGQSGLGRGSLGSQTGGQI